MAKIADDFQGDFYDLDTFEGRTGFDAMVREYIAMDQDIAGYSIEYYAEEVWENLRDGIDFVNDTEAKARIFAVAVTVLKAEQEWRAETQNDQ